MIQHAPPTRKSFNPDILTERRCAAAGHAQIDVACIPRHVCTFYMYIGRATYVIARYLSGATHRNRREEEAKHFILRKA